MLAPQIFRPWNTPDIFSKRLKIFIQHHYFFFSGRELTLPFLSTSGFSKPILIPEAEGLGLTVPENDFCILDIPSGQCCQYFGLIFIVF